MLIHAYTFSLSYIHIHTHNVPTHIHTYKHITYTHMHTYIHAHIQAVTHNQIRTKNNFIMFTFVHIIYTRKSVYVFACVCMCVCTCVCYRLTAQQPDKFISKIILCVFVLYKRLFSIAARINWLIPCYFFHKIRKWST